MDNKNGFSLVSRLLLVVIFVIVFYVGVTIVAFIGSLCSVIFTLHPIERGVIVAASIITAGMITSSGILSLSIYAFFGRVMDSDETKDGEENE